MKTQTISPKSPIPIWQLLHKIDNLLGQTLPLPAQLEKINSVLIEALDVDGIWLLTANPLPSIACGLMRAPSRIAPNATISIVDTGPPTKDNYPVSNTLVEQTIAGKTPLFFQPDTLTNGQTGSDLGDVLFKTFKATPLAIVPLVVNDASLGALVIGNKGQVTNSLSEETQSLLAYLGKHLAQNLQNTYLAERSRRHADILLTLNRIAQTITSSLDIDDVIQKTMAGINTILDVEAGSLLLLDKKTDELYFKITLRGENKQVTSYRLKKGEGIAGWVVANNQPVIVNNTAADKRFLSRIDEAIGFKTRMVLCTPLVVQGEPTGALEVLNKRTGTFDADDR